MKQLALLGFDDELITLRDGAVNVDGVQVRGSQTCIRDPRKANPTLELLQRVQSIFTPKIYPVPKGKKYCSECAEWLPLDQFHKNSSRRDGHSYVCGNCERGRQRLIYARKKNLLMHRKRLLDCERGG